jgi:hypothetical protein
MRVEPSLSSSLEDVPLTRNISSSNSSSNNNNANTNADPNNNNNRNNPFPTMSTDDAQELSEDVVYVLVVRGKRTALTLWFINWIGSLSSFSVLASADFPRGSVYLATMNFIVFISCALFLIPPFLSSLLARFRGAKDRWRTLVLVVAALNACMAILTFIAAVVASSIVQECQNIKTPGVCGKYQGSIAVSFIVSIALAGTFLVTFVGSIVPRDASVQTYLKGLGSIAAARLAPGGGSRRGSIMDDYTFVGGGGGTSTNGGFRAVPLFAHQQSDFDRNTGNNFDGSGGGDSSGIIMESPNSNNNNHVSSNNSFPIPLSLVGGIKNQQQQQQQDSPRNNNNDTYGGDGEQNSGLGSGGGNNSDLETSSSSEDKRVVDVMQII